MAHIIAKPATRRRSYWRNHQTQMTGRLEQFFTGMRRNMTQMYRINPLYDHTIKAKNGMRFYIPALAFENEWGEPIDREVDIEIIELTKKSDIVLADRATTSEGQLLETGGAFFFGARRNNIPLRLGAPVQASVPVGDRVRRPYNMSIFSGQTKNGSFDWNPDQERQASLKLDTIAKTFQVSVRQPGWINCDHYYRLSRRQPYYLQITAHPDLEEQEVFLLYRTINTVAKMQQNADGTFSFPNPIPLPSIIYGLGANQRQFYQGFHPIITDPYRKDVQKKPPILELSLNMTPVNQEDVSSKLEELIRFWDRETTDLVSRRARQRYQRYMQRTLKNSSR